jgi:hypothetical protein
MRLTGTLIEIEPYAGEFTGENGREVHYEGERLHVLDGREVIKVKIPKLAVGKTGLVGGQPIDCRVQVSAQVGARGPYLTTLLVDSKYVQDNHAGQQLGKG